MSRQTFVLFLYGFWVVLRVSEGQELTMNRELGRITPPSAMVVKYSGIKSWFLGNHGVIIVLAFQNAGLRPLSLKIRKAVLRNGLGRVRSIAFLVHSPDYLRTSRQVPHFRPPDINFA